MLSHFKCPTTLFSYFQPSQSFSAWMKKTWDKRVASLSLHVLTSPWFSFLSNSPWKQEGGEKRKRSSAPPEERRGARRSTWYDSILANFYSLHMSLYKSVHLNPDPLPADALNQPEERQKASADRCVFSKMLTASEQSHCCRQQEARCWWALVHTSAFVL